MAPALLTAMSMPSTAACSTSAHRLVVGDIGRDRTGGDTGCLGPSRVVADLDRLAAYLEATAASRGLGRDIHRDTHGQG